MGGAIHPPPQKNPGEWRGNCHKSAGARREAEKPAWRRILSEGGDGGTRSRVGRRGKATAGHCNSCLATLPRFCLAASQQRAAAKLDVRRRVAHSTDPKKPLLPLPPKRGKRLRSDLHPILEIPSPPHAGENESESENKKRGRFQKHLEGRDPSPPPPKSSMGVSSSSSERGYSTRSGPLRERSRGVGCSSLSLPFS